MLWRVGGEAYNVVEALGSTQASRPGADDEDVNVTTGRGLVRHGRIDNMVPDFWCRHVKLAGWQAAHRFAAMVGDASNS